MAAAASAGLAFPVILERLLLLLLWDDDAAEEEDLDLGVGGGLELYAMLCPANVAEVTLLLLLVSVDMEGAGSGANAPTPKEL
jgi:hypothetical protein|mmetsp:Transcript_28206/g.51397  ORF Transcript_28206/g.51397 Transcript_28206/m.51397 type:complete len:83 (-) Transcript_28206:318-566(-)